MSGTNCGQPGCFAQLVPDTFFASSVEQERRAVDQSPGQILGERQPRLLQLLGAQLHVVAKLSQLRIDGQRLADLGQTVAQLLQLPDRRDAVAWPRPGPARVASVPHRCRDSMPAVPPSAGRCAVRPATARMSAMFLGRPCSVIGRGGFVTDMRKRPSVCWPSGNSWSSQKVNSPGPEPTLSRVSNTAVRFSPVFGWVAQPLLHRPSAVDRRLHRHSRPG